MKKANITVTTYGGYVGWTLRKYFSKYTSKAYIEWQYAVRKHLFKKYMHWFYREIDLKGRVPLPGLISIETINRCNNTCEFCPAGRETESRPFKKMSEQLFYKIIKELKELHYDGYLNLYVNNEPFMDTRIEAWYRYAKQQLPDAKMLLYTNGLLLTKKRFDSVIPYIDKMIINNYSEELKLHDNIAYIYKYVKHSPALKEKDISIQIRYIKEILTNRAGTAPNKIEKEYSHKRCVMPFTDFTIYPDGAVGLCCNDALEKTCYGNVNEQSVYEIWTSRQYEMLRKKIGQDRSLYSFCENCDFVDAGIRNIFMKGRMESFLRGGGYEVILVTGGAGYIGSHVNKELHKRGYETVIYDNLCYGHEQSVKWGVLEVGELNDEDRLREVFEKYVIDAVIHFAAYAYVGESVSNPAKYYQNNVCNTLRLLDIMRFYQINTIVFSSSCATYGIPSQMPITEDIRQTPINPYGRTKWIVEQILEDYKRAYGVRYCCLRYFNAAGADPDGEIGESHDPETHLIPLILDAASGNTSSVSIFGTDYPTEDGTCIRDYIHVTDLADAHIRALEYLNHGGESTCFNLGNGKGESVKHVIDTVRKVTGTDFLVKEELRRPGDPPVLIGSSQKARQILGWRPQYGDLETIIEHAWNWHQKKKY